MSYDDEENRIVVEQPLNWTRVNLHSEPVCTTMFLLENGVLLTDPTKQEEDFMRSYVIVCTVDGKKMCLIRKYGGMVLVPHQIGMCVERGFEQGNYIRKNFYKDIGDK